MIWRFDFSRRALAWLLGISFVAGTGLELREQWLGRSAAGESRIVSLGIDPALAKIADSLHQVKVEELSRPININTATAAELDLLPGVGPSIAAKVLAYRESRSFGDITHLLRVKGIGRKTFKKLKPFLTIDGETTLRAAGEAKPTSSGDSSQTDDADDIDDAASES